MNNIFFFQTHQILENSNLFDQLKDQKIFFSYFQVDQNYYLLVYAQKSIDINFLYQSIDVIQELDSKQRKIRSFRGFFLYALEIMENGKDDEILSTNLQPFFWRKVKNIIRQNQKAALLEFLFGKAEVTQDQPFGLIPHLQDQIKALKNQVDSLHQKIIELEQNQTLEIKKPLSELLKRSKAAQIGEQDNTTLKPNISSYLQENDTKIHSNLQKELSLTEQQAEETKSKSLSDASKSDFKALADSQQ
jgi:hypothetical protein